MAASVIDQFVVKLGLDPKDFTKGEKEAAGAFLELERKAGKATEGIGKHVEGAAKSIASSGGIVTRVLGRAGFIGLAIAATIAAGKILTDQLYEVAEEIRRLGLDSKNFDIAAGKLRNLQNASELVGGEMDDATKSVGGLQKAMFDLRFNGQVSDQLIMLARLGVQFQDASGRARDFNDVLLDTASALEQHQKQGLMTRGEAYQFAQAAGFQGGMAQLAVGGRAAAEAELSAQAARRQVGGADVEGATDWVRSRRSLDQAWLSEAGVPLMQKESMAAAPINRGKEWAVNNGSALVGTAYDMAATAVKEFAAAAVSATRALGNIATSPFKIAAVGMNQATRQGMFQSYINDAADKYGIDRDILTGVARTESGFNPNAVSGKGAVGIMQLTPKNFKGAGEDPIKDIYTAAGELRRLFDNYAAEGGGSEQALWVRTLMAYHAGETGEHTGKGVGPLTRAYPGKVLQDTGLALPTPNAQSSSSSTTNVDIASITVNTQAKDADQVAAGLDDSLKRKLLVSHGESGMQ